MKGALNLLLVCAAFLASCSDDDNAGPTLFEEVDNTGIDFNNRVVDDSLENSFLFRNFYNGGGVAIGDLDQDGWADIFFTSNAGENKLYKNKGNWQFEDISDAAGIIKDDKWNTGVAFADVNGDGLLDIYVCSSGHMGTGTRKNKLYINEGNMKFLEQAASFGLDISAYSTQVSFFDYDMDGDLDCFMINNSPIPINQLNFANRRDLPDSLWKIGDFLKGGGDHLYRNDNGFFREVTREAGIHGGLISFGLGVSVGDINGDHYPDVFVSNDSYERDYLYINQQDGTFKDEMEDWFQHTSFSSMGADLADINNDGYPDLFSTDMLPGDDYRLKTTGSFDHIDVFNRKLKEGFFYQYTKNCLQLNNGNGQFIDIARYSGVNATDWSWGALMFDMDNDGWTDLYVCNGVNRDVTNLDFMDFFANDVVQKMVLTGKKDNVDKVLKEIPQTPLPNKVFRNNRDLTFSDIGKSWGLGKATLSNGAAYGDLDNDGDLDLVLNNENQPALIYRNRSTETAAANFWGIFLKGKDSSANRYAIGSKVTLYAADKMLTRELIPSRGFQSSVDYKLIFGLGQIKQIDSVRIVWPDRTDTLLRSVSINRVDSIQQAGKSKPGKLKQQKLQTFFTAVPNNLESPKQDAFIDFNRERGIPKILSQEGPHAAVADVNGDGKDDVYIAGTIGQAGQLYLQQSNGSFTKSQEGLFSAYADFEDVATVFFDCDNDGDQDLLIGPGGNEATSLSRSMQIRLFINDGKGQFSLQTGSFPQTGMNIAVAAVNDVNGDGYADLFIGSRSVPGQYGDSPPSYLFLNDGKGHFTDVAAARNKSFAHLGMITDALWVDITGDGKKELVITGEWMPTRIFQCDAQNIKELETNISGLNGWWQCLATGDFDQDGKQDLIVGNVGENFSFRPDSTHPVKLWLYDFDNNGDVNKLLTSRIDGEDRPVFLKHDLEEQLPFVKKNHLRHEQYAGQGVVDLFGTEAAEKATVKLFNEAASVLLLNRGNGKFEVQKLPVAVQLSSLNKVLVKDLNGDGKVDLICAGNMGGFLPQFEKLDGNLGQIWMGKGNGQFTQLPVNQTGLLLRGEIRDLQWIGNTKLLVLQNEEQPLLYQISGPL